MKKLGLLPSACTAVLLLMQSANLAPASAVEKPTPLQVAINATFDHPPQSGMYRTLLSSVNPLAFTGDQTGGMTALFLMEPGDCFGIASWIAAGNQSKGVGPADICIANSTVTEQHFNSWLDRGKSGKQSGVDPRLIIPLGPPKPTEPIPPGQMQSQTRLNTSRVTAQIFLHGCDANGFHKYGDLVFEQGTLAFTFWTDNQGTSQVNLSANPALLQKLNSDTWNLIRDGCDVAQALPPSPADGQSASFAGTSLQQPPNPASLSGQISLLVGQINGLVFQQQLGDKAAGKLLRWLDQTVTSLQHARPDQAAHALQEFRDSLTTLGDKGLIDAAAAASLAKGALGIETFLADRVNLPLPPPPDPALYCSGNGEPCPDTLSSCKFTSWQVDGASSDPAPDGSPTHPFASITEALEQAAKMKLCGVTLNVAPARYAGPLEITRHTRIIGLPDTFLTTIVEGSVSNHGPYSLEIANITLSWFHDEVANGVFVDHPCAMTLLDHVAVLGYRGFGVRQRGGSLLSQRTIVANTFSQPDSLAQGTGMFLNCGVKVNLSDVVLDSNESAALFMAGLGTEVQAISLRVLNTRVHPSLAGAAPGAAVNWGGAVHVRDQAYLDATSFYISENWLVGVIVDTGAVAVLDLGTINHTRPATLSPPVTDGSGGVNAMAYRGGRVQMSSFIVTRADLCGVYVAPDGEMDLLGIHPLGLSEVSRSNIGACVQVPGYHLSRLDSAVAYVDNGSDFEGTDFPVPDVSDVAGAL